MAEKIVASAEPTYASDVRQSNDGYGQNGFGGASSDLPGKNTRSGFLPGPDTPVNDQLRKVKSDQYPAAFGMKQPKGK